MANKTVNQLNSLPLPIIDSDKILVSRDGLIVSQSTIGDLPKEIMKFQWVNKPDPNLYAGRVIHITDVGTAG